MSEHAHHDEHEEHSDHQGHDHPPLGNVTAFMGPDLLELPQVQRQINEYTDEALLAILPGFTLAHWSLLAASMAARCFVLVFISALFGSTR